MPRARSRRALREYGSPTWSRALDAAVPGPPAWKPRAARRRRRRVVSLSRPSSEARDAAASALCEGRGGAQVNDIDTPCCAWRTGSNRTQQPRSRGPVRCVGARQTPTNDRHPPRRSRRERCEPRASGHDAHAAHVPRKRHSGPRVTHGKLMRCAREHFVAAGAAAVFVRRRRFERLHRHHSGDGTRQASSTDGALTRRSWPKEPTARGHAVRAGFLDRRMEGGRAVVEGRRGRRRARRHHGAALDAAVLRQKAKQARIACRPTLPPRTRATSASTTTPVSVPRRHDRRRLAAARQLS